MNTSFSFTSNASSSSSGNSSRLNPEDYRAEAVSPVRPVAPDINELLRQYSSAPRTIGSTGKLGKSLDSLITATRVASGQTANNAERSYSNRLMQLGISPVASGVVRGQVQTAGNKEVADLTVQKEQMQQQARKDAAMAAAQIASQIAGIRESYSRTLADFNLRESQMKQQNNQFNAGAALDAGKTNMAAEQSAADIAAKLNIAGVDANGNLIRDPKTGAPITPGGAAGGSGSFYPGYIPSFGPIRPGSGYAHANGNNVFMGGYAGVPA